MPRDVNGNVTPPPGTIVNSGDAIMPSQHNPVVTDYAAMLEQSLSRDGQGGMRAPLNMNGFKISNVGTATLPGDAVSLGQLGAIGSPVGSVIDFAGSTPPVGWMLCYGQSLSRTAYPALFAAIGTTYGAPSGSTFSLPDCRGRATAGRDDMGGASAARLAGVIHSHNLGASGGDQFHTLTVAQMPAHSHPLTDPGHKHSLTDPGHSHTVNAISIGSGSYGLGTSGTLAKSGGLSTSSSSTGVSMSNASTGITISSRGGGNPHPNVQPTIIFNKIIKVQ